MAGFLPRTGVSQNHSETQSQHPPLVFRQNPGDLETNNSPSFPRWESSIRMQGRGVIRDRWCTAAKGPNVLCSSTGGNGPANSFDPESVKTIWTSVLADCRGFPNIVFPYCTPPPQRHHKHTTHLGVHVVAGQGALGYTLPWVGGTAHPPAPRGGGGRRRRRSRGPSRKAYNRGVCIVIAKALRADIRAREST